MGPRGAGLRARVLGRGVRCGGRQPITPLLARGWTVWKFAGAPDARSAAGATGKGIRGRSPGGFYPADSDTGTKSRMTSMLSATPSVRTAENGSLVSFARGYAPRQRRLRFR